MSDPITFNLAAHGYNVAKYVPYGPIREAIPYLIRRAQENTSVAAKRSANSSCSSKSNCAERLNQNSTVAPIRNARGMAGRNP